MKQLTSTQYNEEIIKKSTFISIVGIAHSPEDAMAFIAKHSIVDATHNCWAYKIQQVYRFNDDGEPSGTAGKPILNAIVGQEFDNTVALVVRHYGGIKLGTGGLMRAYGGGVSRCLQASPFETIKSYSEIYLTTPFALIQSVHNLSSIMNAQILTENFNENGAIMAIKILSSLEQEFIDKCINSSKGQIFIITDEEFKSRHQ